MTQAARLEELTREGELAIALAGGRVQCVACAHRCRIQDGQVGVCKVRSNAGGKLRVPWGYVNGVQADPIEKKPFFHVRPGSVALSFGMLGCDFHCGYCQNWLSSQALRDERSRVDWRELTPEEIVELARRAGAASVVSTYNEPLITAEWGVAVFRAARAAGLLTGFVSNGYATPEVLDYLRPWVDLFKVDLKGFHDRHYRDLGGRLEPVLDSIRRMQAMGFWVEIVTLLVPGFNDGGDELAALTGFLAGVSVDIPWHVTAFHPDYKMTGPRATTAGDLLRAAEIGRAAGLRYVYAGNAPGRVGNREDTRCRGCGATLVRRTGYRVEVSMGTEGRCRACGLAAPGRW